MVEGYLTPDQKSIIENKPQGNMQNVFPQKFINRNEKVIFEGRPSIVSYIVRPILLGIIYFIFVGIGVYSLLNPFDPTFALIWLIFILVVILILPMLFSILGWSRTYYAMTDRRVTHTYGLFSQKSSDIPIDKVMSILMLQPLFERLFGYGSIVYTTAGAGGNLKLKNFYKTGAVVWRAAKNPVQLKNYVQEVSDILQKAQKAKDYKDMAKAMKE